MRLSSGWRTQRSCSVTQHDPREHTRASPGRDERETPSRFPPFIEPAEEATNVAHSFADELATTNPDFDRLRFIRTATGGSVDR